MLPVLFWIPSMVLSQVSQNIKVSLLMFARLMSQVTKTISTVRLILLSFCILIFWLCGEGALFSFQGHLARLSSFQKLLYMITDQDNIFCSGFI
jgi:hypothetical protein